MRQSTKGMQLPFASPAGATGSCLTQFCASNAQGFKLEVVHGQLWLNQYFSRRITPRGFVSTLQPTGMPFSSTQR